MVEIEVKGIIDKQLFIIKDFNKLPSASVGKSG